MAQDPHLPQLTAVREAHRFDEASLARYLDRELPGFAGKLRVRQFEGGQSNPTYLLESGEARYVLRKKPPGVLLRSAHQVDREYRVIRALEGSGVPVPRAYLLCEDESVIGTSFFVMDYVEGRVLTDTRLPGFRPDERKALFEHAVETLAGIHTLDPSERGLDGFGRPGNYYARQISRWSKQYEASKTVEIPSMEALMEWLPEHVPESDETRVVHGDYRIGNCIIHPEEPRILAVLDWEISTLGHPHGDLAYFCLSYHGGGTVGDDLMDADLDTLGIPKESELVARYAQLTGSDPRDHWSFYIVFQLFRAASIVQGVYKRGLDGNASSETATQLGHVVRSRADIAWELAQS